MGGNLVLKTISWVQVTEVYGDIIVRFKLHKPETAGFPEFRLHVIDHCIL